MPFSPSVAGIPMVECLRDAPDLWAPHALCLPVTDLSVIELELAAAMIERLAPAIGSRYTEHCLISGTPPRGIHPGQYLESVIRPLSERGHITSSLCAAWRSTSVRDLMEDPRVRLLQEEAGEYSGRMNALAIRREHALRYHLGGSLDIRFLSCGMHESTFSVMRSAYLVIDQAALTSVAVGRIQSHFGAIRDLDPKERVGGPLEEAHRRLSLGENRLVQEILGQRTLTDLVCLGVGTPHQTGMNVLDVIIVRLKNGAN